MVQWLLTGARFFGALRRCLAKKDEWAHQFTRLLFRPEGILLYLLLIVGTLSALTPVFGHVRYLIKQVVNAPKCEPLWHSNMSTCPQS